jgi:hypothetical protein
MLSWNVPDFVGCSIRAADQPPAEYIGLLVRSCIAGLNLDAKTDLIQFFPLPLITKPEKKNEITEPKFLFRYFILSLGLRDQRSRAPAEFRN